MNILKNRTIAVFLSLVLVIGSTLISASAKLNADIQKVTDGFYTGALYDGEKTADVADASGSIYKQLTVITAEADKIYAVIANSGADGEAIKEASYYLKSNLSSMHEYVSSIYWSYSELCDALTAIKPKLGAMGLSESEYDEISDEYDAITLAVETLRSADSELQGRFSPRLGKLAAEYMSFMTGGRYTDVFLNRDFSARAKTNEDIVPREAEYLSAGTLDLMYLAVRLAVCELAMPKGEPCPLIIDDALVNLDETRLTEAMKLLRELARERQIILFTCREVPTTGE